MIRNEDGSLTLTAEEADMIEYFIDRSLDSAWDRYTSNYICEGVSLEDGMRRMDSDLYDIMEEMRKSKYDF